MASHADLAVQAAAEALPTDFELSDALLEAYNNCRFGRRVALPPLEDYLPPAYTPASQLRSEKRARTSPLPNMSAPAEVEPTGGGMGTISAEMPSDEALGLASATDVALEGLTNAEHALARALTRPCNVGVTTAGASSLQNALSAVLALRSARGSATHMLLVVAADEVRAWRDAAMRAQDEVAVSCFVKAAGTARSCLTSLRKQRRPGLIIASREHLEKSCRDPSKLPRALLYDALTAGGVSSWELVLYQASSKEVKSTCAAFDLFGKQRLESLVFFSADNAPPLMQKVNKYLKVHHPEAEASELSLGTDEEDEVPIDLKFSAPSVQQPAIPIKKKLQQTTPSFHEYRRKISFKNVHNSPTETEPERKTRTKPEPVRKARSKPDPVRKTQPKTEPERKTGIEPKFERRSLSKPELERKSRFKPEAERKPRSKPETERKPRSKPETERKPQSKPETERKPRSKPETERKPQSKPETERKPRLKHEPERKLRTYSETKRKTTCKLEFEQSLTIREQESWSPVKQVANRAILQTLAPNLPDLRKTPSTELDKEAPKVKVENGASIVSSKDTSKLIPRQLVYSDEISTPKKNKLMETLQRISKRGPALRGLKEEPSTPPGLSQPFMAAMESPYVSLRRKPQNAFGSPNRKSTSTAEGEEEERLDDFLSNTVIDVDTFDSDCFIVCEKKRSPMSTVRVGRVSKSPTKRTRNSDWVAHTKLPGRASSKSPANGITTLKTTTPPGKTESIRRNTMIPKFRPQSSSHGSKRVTPGEIVVID